uniref:Uncharacterized protein n=1 Tax=Cacopsylla melanoneura TaxID=428564 RepID=A0A8D9FEG1_9HEMI
MNSSALSKLLKTSRPDIVRHSIGILRSIGLHSNSGGDSNRTHSLEVAFDDADDHQPKRVADKLKRTENCTVPFPSPRAPVSAGGDWEGPCLMDFQPVPQGPYQEGYKKFHRDRLALLGVGALSLTLGIMALLSNDLLVRRK